MDFTDTIEAVSNQTYKLESPQSLTLAKVTYDDKFALLVVFAIMIGILFMIGVLYLKDKLSQKIDSLAQRWQIISYRACNSDFNIYNND